MNKISKLVLLALSTAALSCSSSKDVYHVRSQAWIGDSIEIQLFETASPDAQNVSAPTITAYCRSCNLVDPPRELVFNDHGIAHVYMPEAIYELAPRIHLEGHGVDTTIILHTRQPAADAEFFHLSSPLIGRVLLTQEAPLYETATQDSVVASVRLGDEMNIFSEDSLFFQVHHPLFPMPLYLLKPNAVRLF